MFKDNQFLTFCFPLLASFNMKRGTHATVQATYCNAGLLGSFNMCSKGSAATLHSLRSASGLNFNEKLPDKHTAQPCAKTAQRIK